MADPVADPVAGADDLVAAALAIDDLDGDDPAVRAELECLVVPRGVA